MRKKLTVWVTPGAEECFHIPDIKIGKHIEVEYQVTSTSATTGNWDIHTRLISPAQELTVLYSERNKEGVFDEEIHQDEGDYKLCFSNYMSTWSEKHVWFEVTVKDAIDYEYDDYFDEDIEEEAMKQMMEGNEGEAAMFDMTVGEIHNSIHAVRIKVGRMKHFQMMYNAHMSSVYLIRQLFEDKSLVHRVFKNRI